MWLGSRPAPVRSAQSRTWYNNVGTSGRAMNSTLSTRSRVNSEVYRSMRGRALRTETTYLPLIPYMCNGDVRYSERERNAPFPTVTLLIQHACAWIVYSSACPLEYTFERYISTTRSKKSTFQHLFTSFELFVCIILFYFILYLILQTKSQARTALIRSF